MVDAKLPIVYNLVAESRSLQPYFLALSNILGVNGHPIETVFVADTKNLIWKACEHVLLEHR